MRISSYTSDVVRTFYVQQYAFNQSSIGYFWIFIIGASLETITFFLFCAKVYVSWRDSFNTPMLSAFIAQCVFMLYVKGFSECTHRGATYYFVVLCFFGISIMATMNKKVS